MDEKMLKVGILGTGRMAGMMADAISKMKHVEVCAVASRNMEDACTFALKYDVKRAYGTYDDLLKDKEVDLVYIASPHSHHALYASQCIDKKKPVLVEKSFTVNAEQAEALIAKAEHEGVFITEAIWTRYMPMAKSIHEIAHSGKIGKINSIRANLGYAKSTRSWMLNPELAGGALLDVGIYPLTFISLIAGDQVTDITSEARKSRSGVDLEDDVIMVIKDGDDEIRCSFYASIIGPTDRAGVVYGTEGYMVVGNVNNFEYIEVYDKDHKLCERIEQPSQDETGYVYELEACRKALAQGKLECDEIPHKTTIRIMKIMDLIRQGMGVSYPFE
jgi:predicted dehydrogenase